MYIWTLGDRQLLSAGIWALGNRTWFKNSEVQEFLKRKDVGMGCREMKDWFPLPKRSL